MNETYKFLDNVNELKWFYDRFIFQPERNEEYCFAMAARNKRLTDEEKKTYALGRAEMLNTQVVSLHKKETYDKEDFFKSFKKAIYRFEVNKKAFTTHTGLPYPEKTLVCYLYLNPCDSLKVVTALSNKIAEVNDSLLRTVANGVRASGVAEVIDKAKALLHKVTRLYPTCPGHKYLIDFDLDVDECYDKKIVLEALRRKAEEYFAKGNFAIVETCGGYHTVVYSEMLMFNPKEFTQAVIDDLKPKGIDVKEFVLNKNGFIPCPGTLQYGKLVQVVNKEDFDD